MEKNIIHLGKVIFLCFGFVLVGQWYVCGQSHVTEKQKEEFVKGNRDIRFLQDYLAALKADSIKKGIDVVLECYLLKLPFEQRYSAANVEDIVKYSQSVESDLWSDIIKHWDKLPLDDGGKKQLADQLDRNCSTAMFDWFVNREKNPELKKPDLEKIQQALAETNVPLSRSKRILVGMWQSLGDVAEMVDLTRQMFADSFTLDGLADWYVFGEMLNYLLEHTNAVQCNAMLKILEMGMEKYGDNTMMSAVKGVKDNFEGKKLMFEMDKE